MKVSPIHAIPKMATTACIPAENTLPCAALAPLVRVSSSISAAVASISISIMTGIPTCTPSNVGRNEGIEPKSTIRNVAPMNRNTEMRAPNRFFTSFSSTCLASSSPDCRRRWYSGSSTSFLPTFIEKRAPTITPTSVAGTLTFRISKRVISKPASNPNRATVAAEIGDAVIACWEAMTAIPNGRSGRILVSVATSAITGNTE